MSDWEWLKQIEVPGLTGVLGVVGTVLTVRSNLFKERGQQEVQRASVMMQTQASRDMAQMTFDAATAATLTDRFKALMDGYERRIEDLSKDLKENRERILNLERHAAVRSMICNDCDKFRQYLKDHPNAFSPA